MNGIRITNAIQGARDSGNRKPITMSDFVRPMNTKTPPIDDDDDNTATENTNINNNSCKDNTRFKQIKRVQEPYTPPLPPPPYTVRATKKGNVPIVIESRKHHKVVVLSNIEGDVEKLLSILKKKLGTGGVRKDNTIEVSGGKEKHLKTISNFCIESGCLVGASKQTKEAVLAATTLTKNKNNSSKKQMNEKEEKMKPTIDPMPLDAIDITPKEIKTMKPTLLKKHLAARQLSTQGNKKELIARLLSVATTTTTSI